MEPISTTLAIISAGSSILSAFNSFKAGKEQQKAANLEAQETERRAKELDIRNKINKALERSQYEKVIGAQKVGYAGSGVDVGTGAPLLAAEEAASELARKQLMMDRETDFELSQMEQTATNLRKYGETQKQLGRLNAMSGLLKSGYDLSQSIYKSTPRKEYEADTQASMGNKVQTTSKNFATSNNFSFFK